MADIKFSDAEKAIIVERIRNYFELEMHQEIGSFEAEFLLDFFAKEFGSYFYNRGLYDAQAALERKLEDVAEAIYELEKPTELCR